MKPSLTPDELFAPGQQLAAAHRAFAARFPGDLGGRQAVHTVYGGAHLFRADTSARLGALALRALDDYAPTADELGRAIDLPPALAEVVWARVNEKLRREPVEDFRIDFEDGYGNRPDAEEDGHAVAAAAEMARGLAARTLPPFCGIRIKPLSSELAPRSLRTLDLFLTALRESAAGAWPEGFVVTLPKIQGPEAVAALAKVLDSLEKKLGLKAGTVVIELMIETPQSVFTADGVAAAPGLVAAGRGRVRSAHFGTYDYTASLDITAAHQRMDHPSCDFAKHVLQVSLAGSGVRISDGATNILPVPPHRATEGGPPLTSLQLEENRRAVHGAWKLHADHVRHSLVGAYYQGWDLHPAQLPTRYAAVFGFFLEGLDAAATRLSHFVGKAAQATLVGEVFDDAATGQGLLNYFLRAINCGAIDETEAVARTGLTLEDFRGRSFLRILERRRGGAQLPR
jgi:citrate lyase beta subunit